MKNLLIAIDFCDHIEKLLDKAQELSTALKAKVWLLHVANPTPDFISFEIGPQVVRDQQAHLLKQDHKRLVEIHDRFTKAGLETTAIMIEGPTVYKILEYAKKSQADLIVMGTHGSGQLHKLLVGSISEGVLKKSHLPVLLVPTKPI